MLVPYTNQHYTMPTPMSPSVTHHKAYCLEIEVHLKIQRMPITIDGVMIHKMRGNQGSFVVREAKSIDCKRETAVVKYSRLSLEL